MKPTVGNYSLHIPYSSGTGWYHPLDGKGTAVDGLSTVLTIPVPNFVSSVRESVITSVHTPASTGSSPEIEFYHGNGALAFKCEITATNGGSEMWEIPDGGMLLTGAWYVKVVVAAAANDWTIFFKVIS